MFCHRTKLSCSALVLLGLILVFHALGEPYLWHEETGCRWAPLPVPTSGKTGFTLLSPAETGINFTNSLDEEAQAANRVLENGSGVAVGDFDNDGLPDIFLCGLHGRNALYKNLGGFKFKDVTAESGILCHNPFCRGAVFADVNGDGNLDLLITTTGGGVFCFINDGNGKFHDATQEAGLSSRHGGVTMTLADVDGNGTLDLYVANNRAEDIRDQGQVDLQMVNGKLVVPAPLQERLLEVDGRILEYGEPDEFYLNDGKGRFTPVSWTNGAFLDEDGRKLKRAPLDWGLTATFRDMNGDGFPDLYVCNDYWTPDRIWINDGRGHFHAIARLALRNTSASSMGVDFADIKRDGLVDFFVVDMLSQYPELRKRQMLAQTPAPNPVGEIENRPQFMRNTLQLNRGDGSYAEVANLYGVPASEWSWQPIFLDVDLDGYEDLLITAGHVKDVQDMDAKAAIDKRRRSYAGYTNAVERRKAFTHDRLLNIRLYPPLNMPVFTYRNNSVAGFDDTTALWGASQPGVHHGIATADFDGDGDLDLVVNNLNEACGIYRNDTIAPRVAVRLKGLPPNTQGIGATIKLIGGAVPMQSAEVISGGRYMSGSDPMRVFAAGGVRDGMRLEVAWRSGKQTVITNVAANRVYEINETSARDRAIPGEPEPKPLFENVSGLLNHTHHEEAFNDFEMQPLLPKKLSQLGPGVAWGDVDGDGWDDLVIASGKGGFMEIFQNDRHGGFRKMTGLERFGPVSRDQTAILVLPQASGPARVLAGAASYEDDPSNGSPVRQFDLGNQTTSDLLPPLPARVGPLALSDLRGDGHLELFVGGRVVPGRYPEAAASRLYRQDGVEWTLDALNTAALKNAGLVSGAVWSDLDGDGYPELILACEWGPIRVFHNDHGRLTAWDPPVTAAQPKSGVARASSPAGYGGVPPPVSDPSVEGRVSPHGVPALSKLSQFTGWWAGVTTGDFDGDGNMDIVAANWGLNSPYHATPEHPLTLYYGDLSQRGLVDLIETEYDPRGNIVAPRRKRDVLAQSLPDLAQRFHSHADYSRASIETILGSDITRASMAGAATLESMVFLNRTNRFESAALPAEAQWSPAFSVNVADFDGDGHEDVFLSQNFFATAPELPRLDAGRGLLLRGDGRGKFTPVPGGESGVKVYGEQRGAAVADYDHDGRPDLVVTQNGAATVLLHNIGAKPGLRVRLSGPPGNPAALGAMIRLKFGARFGPAREIHGGSGYWSEDSPVQVMAAPEPPTELWVRWPGGRTTTTPIPPGATEIAAQAPQK